MPTSLVRLGVAAAMVVVCEAVLGAIPPRSQEIDALLARADALASQQVRRSSGAVPLYRQAIRLAQQQHDAPREAGAWGGLGDALLHLHQQKEARQALERARTVAQRNHLVQIDADALGKLALIDFEEGDIEQAEQRARQWEELGVAHRMLGVELRALNMRAAFFRRVGRSAESIEVSRDALRRLDDAQRRHETFPNAVLFQIPYNYGSALIDSGQYSRGFALLDRALTAATNTHSLPGVWHVLQDTAEWYRQQNDLERAGRYYDRALKQAQALDSRDPEALTRVGMGRLELARGRLPEAERHCLEAMRLLTSAGQTAELPLVLLQLSRIHSASGNLAAARTSIEQDIELSRRIGMSGELIQALIEIARIERQTGDARRSAQHASEAVELVRTRGLRPLLPSALNELGSLALEEDARVAQTLLSVRRQTGVPVAHLARAADLFEESVRAAEGLRPNMTGVEQRRAFDESSHAAYAGLLETRLRAWRRDQTEARAVEAFLVVERERTAPLIETIRSAARTGRGSEAAQMDARIAQLQWKLSLPGRTAAQRDALVHELDDAERRREATDAAADLEQPFPPKILDLSTLQWTLHPTEALLEYAASESSRVVFVITRDRVGLADIGPDADASRTAFFTDLICRGKAGQGLAAGSRLSLALLTPAFAVLRSPARRLFIAAAGDLAVLPFAALPYPPRGATPLLLSFEIAYTPSLGTLAYLRRRHGGAARVDLLALSNPTALRRMSQLDTATTIDLRELPFSAQEIESISRYVSSRDVLSGSAATERALKARDLASYKIVHFATHAVLDPVSPRRSAVILARGSGDEDGLLQEGDIAGLRLNGQLVVLSGCETASGKVSAAHGAFSLARAFLTAGARSVVGTLAGVDDRASAQLVTSFYERLANGESTASAMRSAQLHVAGSRPYETAAIWAPWIVSGDGAMPVELKRPRPRASGWIPVAAGAIIAMIALGVGMLTGSRGHGVTG